MHCKAFKNLDRNSLYASVHPHSTYLPLFSFSLLAAYLKVLMSECLHFFHTTTGFLHYNGWMTLQLGWG